MQRRSLLAAGPALAATGFAPLAHAAALSPETSSGPRTFYAEFRIAPPGHDAAMAALRALGAHLAAQAGFLHLSLKQMTGDSTMVKNYPESYKGVLATAYLDGLRARRLPYFYALFVRFIDAAAMHAAQPGAAFARAIAPPRSPRPMAWYEGVFETIAAGNRDAILQTPAAIAAFLRNPADGAELTTVGNHVFIDESAREQFDRDVAALLRVAQQTYQPESAANRTGLPGARDNRFYRKAVSTEILRKTTPDGALRAYLMHGVWDSVWDHENSHLDPRFQKAAGPVGAAVSIGPVEPFYRTTLSVGPL